jgi:hypothetical protein
MVGDDSPTCFTWSRMYCSIYLCGRSTILIMFYDAICSHPWISIHILCCRFDKIFKLWYINCHAIFILLLNLASAPCMYLWPGFYHNYHN